MLNFFKSLKNWLVSKIFMIIAFIIIVLENISQYILYVTGPLTIIYYVDNGLRNVTFDYSGKYNKGTFFCVRYHSLYNVEYFIYHGCIYNHSIFKFNNNNKIERKSFYLTDDKDSVCDFDLNIIDNYVKNVLNIKDTEFYEDRFLSTKFICKLFNIRASKLMFQKFIPYEKNVIAISDDHVISELYSN